MAVQIVHFRGPYDETVAAAEYDVRSLTDYADAATAYRQRWRVSVRLDQTPDDWLPSLLELLDTLTTADGGEMWEIEDSVLLLTPSSVAGPDSPDGLAGDRSPNRPRDPNLNGSMKLDPPHCT